MNTLRKIRLRHNNLEMFKTPCPNDRKPCKGYKNLRDLREKKNIILRIFLYTCTYILLPISYATNFFFSPTVFRFYEKKHHLYNNTITKHSFGIPSRPNDDDESCTQIFPLGTFIRMRLRATI